MCKRAHTASYSAERDLCGGSPCGASQLRKGHYVTYELRCRLPSIWIGHLVAWISCGIGSDSVPSTADPAVCSRPYRRQRRISAIVR
ncbi:hypothetical protein GDO78_009052 [Eleutherodactylus coqui]|uniref:Uncharacterized protein n=1 Tax=Eleutherodactylus coqui TaxID=57060 RepID=A0A8J6F6K0_ELECQ|nr:hypothetical protein GDO78_009052 [Eleutherodactylus coqui]